LSLKNSIPLCLKRYHTVNFLLADFVFNTLLLRWSFRTFLTACLGCSACKEEIIWWHIRGIFEILHLKPQIHASPARSWLLFSYYSLLMWLRADVYAIEVLWTIWVWPHHEDVLSLSLRSMRCNCRVRSTVNLHKADLCIKLRFIVKIVFVIISILKYSTLLWEAALYLALWPSLSEGEHLLSWFHGIMTIFNKVNLSCSLLLNSSFFGLLSRIENTLIDLHHQLLQVQVASSCRIRRKSQYPFLLLTRLSSLGITLFSHRGRNLGVRLFLTSLIIERVDTVDVRCKMRRLWLVISQ
jgi:hypothetical protein